MNAHAPTAMDSTQAQAPAGAGPHDRALEEFLSERRLRAVLSFVRRERLTMIRCEIGTLRQTLRDWRSPA